MTKKRRDVLFSLWNAVKSEGNQETACLCWIRSSAWFYSQSCLSPPPLILGPSHLSYVSTAGGNCDLFWLEKPRVDSYNKRPAVSRSLVGVCLSHGSHATVRHASDLRSELLRLLAFLDFLLFCIYGLINVGGGNFWETSGPASSPISLSSQDCLLSLPPLSVTFLQRRSEGKYRSREIRNERNVWVIGLWVEQLR